MKQLMLLSVVVPLAGCAVDNVPRASFAAPAHPELTAEDRALLETAPEVAILAVATPDPCRSGFITGSRIRRVTCVAPMTEAEAILLELKTDYEIDYARRLQLWAEGARLDGWTDVPEDVTPPPFH